LERGIWGDAENDSRSSRDCILVFSDLFCCAASHFFCSLNDLLAYCSIALIADGYAVRTGLLLRKMRNISSHSQFLFPPFEAISILKNIADKINKLYQN